MHKLIESVSAWHSIIRWITLSARKAWLAMGVPQTRRAIRTCLYLASSKLWIWQHYGVGYDYQSPSDGSEWIRHNRTVVWYIRQLLRPHILLFFQQNGPAHSYMYDSAPAYRTQLSTAYQATALWTPGQRFFGHEPDWAHLGHSWLACACSPKAASDLLQLEQALKRECRWPFHRHRFSICSNPGGADDARLWSKQGWTHAVTLWTLDSDCLIPCSAVSTQWNEPVTMKFRCFQKWTSFPNDNWFIWIKL